MKYIIQFQGDYSFLSNFYHCSVEMDGKVYPSVEHAFQAAKTHDCAKRDIIRKAPTPSEAKRLGRKLLLRSDWEKVKVDIMQELVMHKFQNPELAAKLVETDDAKLIEGNWWNDTFWGVCNGKGENRLGQILESVRTTLIGRGLNRKQVK